MGGFVGAVIFLLLLAILGSIRIVPQSEVFVVERLGKFYTTWSSGLHLKIPKVDRIVKKVSLKEQTLNFAPQPFITKDNVTMRIDSIVVMRVTDAKLFTYGVGNPINGLESLTATTFRSIVGSMNYDETLTSRDRINARMETTLDAATAQWGIKVIRVEIKNIQPSAQI